MASPEPGTTGQKRTDIPGPQTVMSLSPVLRGFGITGRCSCEDMQSLFFCYQSYSKYCVGQE